MKDLLLIILGTSISQIFTFLLYKGFIMSYWGKNSREEVTRWWDQFRRLLRGKK